MTMAAGLLGEVGSFSSFANLKVFLVHIVPLITVAAMTPLPWPTLRSFYDYDTTCYVAFIRLIMCSLMTTIEPTRRTNRPRSGLSFCVPYSRWFWIAVHSGTRLFSLCCRADRQHRGQPGSPGLLQLSFCKLYLARVSKQSTDKIFSFCFLQEAAFLLFSLRCSQAHDFSSGCREILLALLPTHPLSFAVHLAFFIALYVPHYLFSFSFLHLV